MATKLKKLIVPIFNILLMLGLAASTALASGPRRPPSGRGYSVAEPTAVILLGAGLVSLGIYAKRKFKNKK
jgi:hypothetical protein